jgi:TetR/AcrR family transcriptional regulator
MRVSAETAAKTRHRLLEAAAEEIAEHGLAAANINRISLAAGLAKGTVYNYFPSKDALFLAVVEEACARAAEGVTFVPTTATVRERLTALLRADVEWARDHEAFARVLVRESLNPGGPLTAAIQEAAMPYVGQVIAVLDEGVARGEVRGDRPTVQLAMVFAGLGQLCLGQHWSTGWPELSEIPEFVVDVFLRGAAKEKG